MSDKLTSIEERIVVTGANGFIGQALINYLIEQGRLVRAATRKLNSVISKCETVAVGDIGPDTDWVEALRGASTVVHLAGRAHVLKDSTEDPLTEFRHVNVLGTIRLAYCAAKLGVNRFVFISTIGVNGRFNTRPFVEDDNVEPSDPYSLSKYEAEIALQKISKETGMEVVIIRPPLVYGVNAPGNFGRLFKAVSKQIPLPLGAVYNKRSFIAVDNLVSFIALCADQPNSKQAANQVFLISDGEDVSTTEFLKKVASAYQKNLPLLPIPVSFMRFCAKILGKEVLANQLFSNLQVNSTKARNLLSWNPIITMDEQLKQMVRHSS